MIELSRVCIPLGLNCNLNCIYCYRDFCRKELPTILSDDMKIYLSQLDYDKCESVIMSGGEPLLYWDTIQEIFSYVPNNIHKKIMTNGLLLTEDKLRYLNDREVEVSISNDGVHTKKMRGVDIFTIPKLLDIIKRIDNLTISSVITKYNCDVIEIYNYMINILDRKDFKFRFVDLMDTGNVDNLIEGFDYDIYSRTVKEFNNKYYRQVSYYGRVHSDRNKGDSGFNVDLEGNIIGMNTLNKYGTIYDTYEECEKNMLLIEGMVCENSNCPIPNKCLGIRQAYGNHYCKCQLIRSGLL